MIMNEEELVEKARAAVSQSNLVVGECASVWTRKYARGRTDTDFGQLLGLSGEQVYQRRRVWETFGSSNTYSDCAHLKWSHLYVALNWEDSTKCLQWAEENEATVAEMRAWRRCQRGEDLFAEPEESHNQWGSPLVMDTLMEDSAPIAPSLAVHHADDVSDDDDYTPFRNAQGGESEVAMLERPPKPAAAKTTKVLDVSAITTILDRMEALAKDPDEIQLLIKEYKARIKRLEAK